MIKICKNIKMAVQSYDDHLRNTYVRAFILFVNNPFYDKEMYDYFFMTKKDNTHLRTKENIKMCITFCDMTVDYEILKTLFFEKYKQILADTLPIILHHMNNCLHNIIEIMKNDITNRFENEKIIIQLLDRQKYGEDICPICMTSEEYKKLTNQVIFTCSHSICHNCWVKSNYNLVCPLCEQKSLKIIVPAVLTIGNHDDLFVQLVKYANESFDNITNDFRT